MKHEGVGDNISVHGVPSPIATFLFSHPPNRACVPLQRPGDPQQDRLKDGNFKSRSNVVDLFYKFYFFGLNIFFTSSYWSYYTDFPYPSLPHPKIFHFIFFSFVPLNYIKQSKK